MDGVHASFMAMRIYGEFKGEYGDSLLGGTADYVLVESSEGSK